MQLLGSTPPPFKKTPDENTQMLEKAEGEYNQMQKDFSKMMNDQEQKLKEAKVKMDKQMMHNGPVLYHYQTSLWGTGLEILTFMALFLMENTVYKSHT